MIGKQQLKSLRDHTGLLVNQITLLAEKVQKSTLLDSRDNTQEEERARVIKNLEVQKKQVPQVLALVEPAVKELPSPSARLKINSQVDSILFSVKHEVETLAKEHDECNLDLHKQEVVKAIELCRESFDWILPQIRNEMMYLEKFYGDPLHAQNTVFPEIETLVVKLEDHQISHDEFLHGFKHKGKDQPGYRELRARNDVYSDYQFYDHSYETYKGINTCYYEISKSMESLFKEWKLEDSFGYFLERIREKSRPIAKMGDIFEATSFLDQFYQQASRKFSFTDEMKRVKPLVKQFHDFRKKLVLYDQDALQKSRSVLDTQYQKSPDHKRYSLIMTRVDTGIKNQTLSFTHIEDIFQHLKDGDFNIVVDTGEPASLEIAITPHHEKVYGRDLLNRINTILNEIEFWYPPKMKKEISEELAIPVQKLQDDDLEDRNGFFKRMQQLDKEVETKIRQSYSERVRESQVILARFEKVFSDISARTKLKHRLLNQNIWNEITPRVDFIKAELAVAGKLTGSRNNVQIFPHLKNGFNELNQMLYDLAMQLFVLFPGAEDQWIANMAGILSICNECHDLPTLWAAFSHYHKKIAIPKFQINESMIIDTSKNPLCKSRFKELSTV